MEYPIDIVLSGRKRISGTKYFENTKTQSRQWTHKKYTSRLEMLRQELRFLEDNDVCNFFMSEEGGSKIKDKCYTFQTYRKMAEEVIKPQQVTSKKARNLKKKKSKLHSQRSAIKRGHFKDD